MTLAMILALFGFPTQRLVADLNKLAQKYPDAAPQLNQYRSMFESRLSFAQLTEMVSVAAAELKELINKGKGPVVHDPVDLS